MTNEEAREIIRKEYLCVDRDCDIERSCSKCDLMMPSKEPILEAYKLAIKALKYEEPMKQAISEIASRILEECFQSTRYDGLKEAFDIILKHLKEYEE